MGIIVFFLLVNIAIGLSIILLLIKKPYSLFALTVIVVNLFTWPLFIYTLSKYSVNIYLAETVIFIVEGCIYTIVLKNRCLKYYDIICSKSYQLFSRIFMALTILKKVY